MGIDCISPSPPGSRQEKWGCLLGRQNGDSMLNSSWTEYPRWEIEGPHWSIILHNMFLHAAKQRCRRRQRGSFDMRLHRQSLPKPDPEADVPAMKLVGYWTSHKEIRDLYHGIYLLRRSPSPTQPCGPWWREEAILDILSSLRNHLHRWGYTATPKEDAPGGYCRIPV